MLLGTSIALTIPRRNTGGEALSNDTSLSTFTIDAEDVLELSSIQRGNGVTEVPVVAVPTHAGAARTINGSGDADPVMLNLSTGDNVVTVTVTAEDGVTTEDHVVTVRRLTAGVQEITEIDLYGMSVAELITGSAGEGLMISNDAGRFGFYFNTGTETQPDWSGFGVGSYIEVSISASATLASILSNLSDSLNTWGFDASNDEISKVVAIAGVPGARVDAVLSGGIASYSVTVTQQGENPS